MDVSIQTDEWLTFHCINCKSISHVDDDNVLCSKCSFWHHFKCIERCFYDGCDDANSSECTFCDALKQQLEPIEIKMKNCLQPDENDFDFESIDSPIDVLNKRQYYWNIIVGDKNIKTGDYIYIHNTEADDVSVWLINNLFKDANENSFASVTECCFPENIIRSKKQKFYPNEIFLMTEKGSNDIKSYVIPIEDLKLITIVVMTPDEFANYIPRSVPPAHIYIERYYYDRSSSNENNYTLRDVEFNYKTCTKLFAMKPREKPLKLELKKFNEVDWLKNRINSKDLLICVPKTT